MRRFAAYFVLMAAMFTGCAASCSGGKIDPTPTPETKTSKQNLTRAIVLADAAMANYFTGSNMTMSRYYNPTNNTRSSEVGSVWMYTSAIQATAAVINVLDKEKTGGDSELYDKYYAKYSQRLSDLVDNCDYYQGTFTLTSYTQTKEWSVYGVNRSNAKGGAEVEGVMNVYDDNEWLVRELIEAYKATGQQKYLDKAEYLASYILDGWDCTLDDGKKPYGGITWGPGYVTKHSCSNGPMVRPLVWLSEHYKNSSDEITYIYIASDYHRLSKTVKKSEYYLRFAKDIYAWQKGCLLRSDGVYDDMMGGVSNGDVTYETVYGVKYRRHENTRDRVGPPYSYNSGTMLSGAACLYSATGEAQYLTDVKALTNATFTYFAKLGASKEGYYTYAVTDFNNWFNSVLMLGYADACSVYQGAEPCIASFQDNLDYGYDNYLRSETLPTNILVGWSLTSGNNQTEALTTFAYAAEYAVLAEYELEKGN
jgi:Predicted glycosyl hydrolase